VKKRAQALTDIITDCKRKLVFLRAYTDSINQHTLLKKAGAMRDDFKIMQADTVSDLHHFRPNPPKRMSASIFVVFPCFSM